MANYNVQSVNGLVPARFFTRLRITANGLARIEAMQDNVNNGTALRASSGATVIYANVGDSFTVQAYQNTGESVAVGVHLSLALLRTV